MVDKMEDNCEGDVAPMEAREHRSIGLNRILHDRDYTIANVSGFRTDAVHWSDWCCGIMVERALVKKKFLWFVGYKKQRALFIAKIWMDKDKNPRITDKWLVEVWGREYLKEVTVLAGIMSRELNISCDVVLMNESPAREGLHSDYSPWW